MVLAIVLIIVLACLCSIRADHGKDKQLTHWISLFGETLYAWKSDTEAEELPTSELLKDKKVVGVYFSASWCGPCRAFTPVLAEFYKKMNNKGKKFEIVFVSRDRSAEEFGEYYAKMPWLAVPLQSLQKVLEKLAPKYDLKGIPHLVILEGDDAEIITLEGRAKVSGDKYGLEFPWRSRSILSLLPRPFRRQIKKEISAVALKLKLLMRGLMDSLAPARLISWVYKKALPQVISRVKNVFAPAVAVDSSAEE